MSELARKYIYKLSQAVDAATLVLQAIKQAPTKAFQEDIDARIHACDTVIKNLQEAKRYLLYFKNKSSGGP